MLCNLTLQLSLFKIFREADVVVSVIRFDSRSCIPAFPFSSTAMCFVFGYEDIHCVCVVFIACKQRLEKPTKHNQGVQNLHFKMIPLELKWLLCCFDWGIMQFDAEIICEDCYACQTIALLICRVFVLFLLFFSNLRIARNDIIIIQMKLNILIELIQFMMLIELSFWTVSFL